MATKTFPGDLKLARQHLRLSRECRERAFDLDPTLRPSAQAASMAMDAANADAERTINGMVRRAFRSELTTGKRRATKVTPMRSRKHAFDAAKLFQKDSEEYETQAPASAYASPDADPNEAADHLRKALAHVGAVEAGSSELNTSRLRKYLEGALEALHVDDERDEADEDGRDEVLGGREDEPALLSGRDRKRARDGVGEVPPRSVVTNDRARRAHDSAPLDANALFQRTAR